MKHTERARENTDDLKKALEVMRVVPKAANDMMNVGRLQGYNVRYAFGLVFLIYFAKSIIL